MLEYRAQRRTPADHCLSSDHLLCEEFFKAALVRERMRSDRSARPFALFLVEFAHGAARPGSSTWAPVVDALVAAKRDTDVAGWLEAQAHLGLLVPEIRRGELGAVCSRIEATLRGEFAKRLPPDTAKISLRSH